MPLNCNQWILREEARWDHWGAKRPSSGSGLKQELLEDNFSEITHLKREQRLHKALGDGYELSGESINHWPGPEHLGSLICIRRNSRCGQTGPYKGRGSLTWLWGYVASCWGKGGGPRLCAPGPSGQGKGEQFYSCLSLDMISWVWTCLNPTLVLGLLPRAPRLQGCWTP